MTDDPRHAVVDRIVEGVAVLLVDPDEQEHHLPADQLPPGAGEGAWLLVTGEASDLRVVGHDSAGEAERRAQQEERLARLRRTRRGGRFS
ncbi:MAG: DUF3006 domain-containing protein [Egibacteraceae bacterium]